MGWSVEHCAHCTMVSVSSDWHIRALQQPHASLISHLQPTGCVDLNWHHACAACIADIYVENVVLNASVFIFYGSMSLLKTMWLQARLACVLLFCCMLLLYLLFYKLWLCGLPRYEHHTLRCSPYGRVRPLLMGWIGMLVAILCGRL